MESDRKHVKHLKIKLLRRIPIQFLDRPLHILHLQTLLSDSTYNYSSGSLGFTTNL